MKFTNSEVSNMYNAIRGMRNPMNSWDKSDSCKMKLGEKDIELAQKLIRAGTEHSKFMRQIFFSVDVEAPIYWWKEMDQYKIGMTTNSTSTMHKLASTPIDVYCFEIDDYSSDLLVYNNEPYNCNDYVSDCAEDIINFLETLRKRYLETKDIRYWKELVRWLPEGWLQKRTLTGSYANLRNIYHQRKNHKLTEWHTFCEWVESLPYAKELIMEV